MKRLLNSIVALLIVFSATTTVKASSTLDSKDAKLKVSPLGNLNQFELTYLTNVEEKVVISILDNDNQLLYKESMGRVRSFVKPFDLGYLPSGSYKFVVTNQGGKTMESEVHVGIKDKVGGEYLSLIPRKDDKSCVVVSPLGLDRDLYLTIYNETGDEIYSDWLSQYEKVSKLYNFSKLKDEKAVRIVVSDGNKIIKDTSFKF